MSRNTRVLNPALMELDHESYFEAEEPDTIADPEGVASRQTSAQQETAPQLLPSYLERDFEWRRGYKDRTVAEIMAQPGGRAYFLQPKKEAVELTIQTAERVLTSATTIIEADDDGLMSVITNLAAEIRDIDYTFGGIDQWLDSTVKRAVARQIASDAVFIARGIQLLNSWRPTDDNGQERKDSFQEVLFSAQKRLAVLRAALGIADPEAPAKLINIRAAAWQRMQSEARRNHAKYYHVEELDALHAHAEGNAAAAQDSVISLLLNGRRPKEKAAA